jgi:hypothetical protein
MSAEVRGNGHGAGGEPRKQLVFINIFSAQKLLIANRIGSLKREGSLHRNPLIALHRIARQKRRKIVGSAGQPFLYRARGAHAA